MADYMPNSSGLWSTTQWVTALANLTAFAGGNLPPGPVDDVYADSKTITIDTDIIVNSLRTTNSPRTNGPAGGNFRPAHNTTTRANILAGTTTVFTFPSAAPNFCTLYGNITGSTVAASTTAIYPIVNSSTGTITITGDFVTCQNNHLFTNNSTGIANIYFIRCLGIGSGGGTPNNGSIVNNSSGVLNLTGNFIADGSYNDEGGLIIQPFSTTGTINFSGAATGGNNVSRCINLRGNGGVFNGIGVFRAGGPASASRTPAVSINGGSTSVTNLTGIFIGSDQSFSSSPAVNYVGNCGSLNMVGTLIGRGYAGCGLIIGAGTTNSPITITGLISGGTQAANIEVAGVLIQGTVTNCVINGNIHGNIGPGLGIFSSTSNGSNITINGNAFGTLGQAIWVAGSFPITLTINGQVRGATGVGLNVTTASTVYVRRVTGAPGGPTNPTGGTAVGLSNSQNGLVYVEEIEFGAQGVTPISGPVFLVNRQNTVLVMRGTSPTFDSTTFFGNLNVPGLFPPVSSVRLGIVYGNGDFTGTMAVPARDAVQIGVPVDNTTGTFVLSPESFWTLKRSNTALNDPTTIGYRIKNLATIASVGRTLAGFNSGGVAGQY